MDDDENRTLDFNEFKKGIREYGLHLEPKVSLTYFFACAGLQNKVSTFAMILNIHIARCSHQAGAT